MLSLSKIDAKISDKRRAMAEQVTKRQELYGTLDNLSEQIDALEAEESPSAEQVAELEKLYTSHKTVTRQAAEAGDETPQARRRSTRPRSPACRSCRTESPS
jgi:septal ring factor EnvC (AmiA/AmiB activator)